MRTLLIALNPKAGATPAGERVRELARLMEAEGARVHIESDLGRLAERAAREHESGDLLAVVSAGGDGTAAEIVNRVAPEVPIALFPLGTENLLSRWVGQQSDPAAVRETILRGRAQRLDAGRANGRIFLLMFSCGFDAAVVQRAHALRSGHISRWHYVRPIFESLRDYRFPRLGVTYAAPREGELETTLVDRSWAFAFNLPCYARGLAIAPEADGADGLLDLCMFDRGSIWHGLRYLGGVILRRRQSLRDWSSARVTSVRIESAAPVPYQLDGDPGGLLPVEIEVVPARFTLLTPPEA